MIRSLRRSARFGHVEVIGTDVCENQYGVHEGLCSRLYQVPRFNDPAYPAAMRAIVRHEAIDAALIVPEHEVLYWAENELPTLTLLPPKGFSRVAIDKASVYAALRPHGLVPPHAILSRADVTPGALSALLRNGPVWMRDHAAGSTSGRGALLVSTEEEARAWLLLNPSVASFMFAEYLPGRNLACLLLYRDGRLLHQASYERVEYFMARVAASGVTGNISRGRIINDPSVTAAARTALEAIATITRETLSGMITVDLREDALGAPKVTEINIRQVAAASAFAFVPGANLTEHQLAATLGVWDDATPLEVKVPEGNVILRDIDGEPIYAAHARTPLAPPGDEVG
jgi:hypothetical protein